MADEQPDALWLREWLELLPAGQPDPFHLQAWTRAVATDYVNMRKAKGKSPARDSSTDGEKGKGPYGDGDGKGKNKDKAKGPDKGKGKGEGKGKGMDVSAEDVSADIGHRA